MFVNEVERAETGEDVEVERVGDDGYNSPTGSDNELGQIADQEFHGFNNTANLDVSYISDQREIDI